MGGLNSGITPFDNELAFAFGDHDGAAERLNVDRCGPEPGKRQLLVRSKDGMTHFH
jgi:hypothetical protein